MYLDCVRDDDVVPLAGTSIQARVLRLDNLTCVSRRSVALASRPLSTAALPATRASSAPPLPRAATASGEGHDHDHDMMGPAAGKPVAKNEFDGMPPLSAEELDEDLRGKDIQVASLIQRRRNKDRAANAAAVAGVRDADAASAAAAETRFLIKAELKPQLEAWAREPGGGLKDVRALLTKLQDVLWEGAKWTPVSMAKLLPESRVKFYVRKAQLVVHPDKLPSLGVREQYISEIVFTTLQDAYDKFTGDT